ncbi:hypothetical protein TSOC_004150 [Tetrabaena socialis]|uniref:Uncharacterized protein n=1 Tax=Tetrabaena socialis TaxID=47790 RepID=A0A2J8A9L7_9CHLO|nr:hypothetical protein TSOC_004150 [Tetrabaena socialis]|eukprot:PNH09227.1 hypothetical protein TSOC_004150 [Tetrabaena socialis]
MTAGWLLLPFGGWPPVPAQRCNMAAGGEGAAGGGVAAAVGGAGGAGRTDHGGGGSHGPSDGGWPQLLLEEVGAVPLLGAALHMTSGADGAAATKDGGLRLRMRPAVAGGTRATGLVPVAEARGVLRTCSYPGHISLAGDGEAEAEA